MCVGDKTYLTDVYVSPVMHVVGHQVTSSQVFDWQSRLVQHETAVQLMTLKRLRVGSRTVGNSSTGVKQRHFGVELDCAIVGC